MKAVYDNTVLAESDNTENVEGNEYFPFDSVRPELLKDSDTHYTCPWKGEAKYYSVAIDGEEIKDGAWSYPEPKEAAENIKNYIAFDISKGIQVRE